jgi:protein-S-isoprenylcysteine O-methyltransferase Ste14
MKKRANLAKILYGLSFVVLLPLLLYFWAVKLDDSLDLMVPQWEAVGILCATLGGILLITGMFDLAFRGKGLPMNAFPPKKFVTGGIYAWFSHPIYLGAALLSAGLSIRLDSGAGLYVVTPVLILAMLSLVYGYESLLITKTFGEASRRHRPLVSIPPFPSRLRRISIAWILFVVSLIYITTVLYLFDVAQVHNFVYLALIILTDSFLSYNYAVIWSWLKSLAQWMANSRRDCLFFGGQFRIINHSKYSGLAGLTGVGIIGWVIGNSWAVLVLVICVIMGAALFAQFRWGSASLLRPFGYWGGIFGGILGIILIWLLFDVPFYQTALAGALSAPFAQAIGRLRCLSQGCCHGIVTRQQMGIQVWQSQSRVVTLSGLKGIPIMPTQLYSISFNFMLGVLLFSIWFSGRFNPSLVAGQYLILTAIERFTEDAYRGEKQTRLARGLKENQWISIAALVTGIGISMLRFPPVVDSSGDLGLAWLLTSLSGGLITAFAMSMDFPKSRIKFSRLSG